MRRLALALLLAAGHASAQDLALGGLTADPSLPVEIEAESLVVDRATGAALFSGGVVIGQGDLRLGADEVEVVYDAETGAVARLRARGGVTVATATEAAEAAEADYDLAARTLTLSGDVLLTQDAGALSAERMVVDLATGTARLDGRVRSVLGAAP